MNMRKDMVAAVLIISVTFGAVTEFQILVVLLCPSADRTLMDRAFGLRTHGDHISTIRAMHHFMGFILSLSGLICFPVIPVDMGFTPAMDAENRNSTVMAGTGSVSGTIRA